MVFFLTTPPDRCFLLLSVWPRYFLGFLFGVSQHLVDFHIYIYLHMYICVYLIRWFLFNVKKSSRFSRAQSAIIKPGVGVGVGVGARVCECGKGLRWSWGSSKIMHHRRIITERIDVSDNGGFPVWRHAHCICSLKTQATAKKKTFFLVYFILL